MPGRHNLRHRARRLLAGAVHSVGGWNLLRPRTRNQALVLGLHRVVTAEQRARAHSLPGMFLSRENFDALLLHLKQRFELLTLDAFLNGSYAHTAKPSCLLTFDDGWEDNFTTAFPLLQQHSVPAAIFLVSGMMGEGSVFWVERLRKAARKLGWPGVHSRLQPAAALDGVGPEEDTIIERLKHMPARQRQEILARVLDSEPGNIHEGDAMMTWEQVRTMSRDGIAFGAHTVSHPLLTYEQPADVERELTAAKTKIESALGRPVESFAYPNGDWNPAVRQAVQAAGYRCAFQVQRGWHSSGDDPFTVRRVFLHDGAIAGPDGKFCPALFEWTVNR